MWDGEVLEKESQVLVVDMASSGWQCRALPCFVHELHY